MIMTVLEARVPANQVSRVEGVFRDAMKDLPPEIVESFLVRDVNDPWLFRLTTVWQSMEALQSMRQASVQPKGVQMFAEVGATPALTIFQVVVHATHE